MENGARANSVPLTAGTKLKKPERKKLNRRNDRDYSQRLRFTVQIVFAALNVWIGVQFYLWVRWAESGGRTFEVSRPAGVEGWLPIEGLTQLKYFFVTGNAPHVHAAGFFLFTSFLIISYAFRKAFCSWICPVGRSPNIYGSWAVHLIGCNFHLPRWSIYRFAR
jgi:polyferredoxin